MSISKYNNLTSPGKWGYPIYLCDCCPYGYHIDLDFVRYCETISKETDTGSIKRRKDRRKQRKSMEVLLGLSSVDDMVKHVEPICPSIEVGNRLLRKRDSFDNVIDDFEKTFQVSKKLSDNLPDVTAVSDTRTLSMEINPTLRGQMGMKKFGSRQFDSPAEYCILSPTTFKNIREQMALSLERTRQLEDEMKQLPQLKDQISLLMDENKLLLQKLRIQENSEKKTRSYNNLIHSFDPRYRSNSFSEIDVGNSRVNDIRTSPVSPISRSTKDIGVTCSVLTRNVGVGPQIPHVKNASTEMTHEGAFVDKWFGEKLKFINDQYETEGKLVEQINKNKTACSKGNQTQRINKYHQITQTENPISKRFTHQQTQTAKKRSTADFGAQKSMDVHTVGVSDDKITDICCEKCIRTKVDVAVGTKTYNDFAPISLSSLSPSRSKSFNLGSDKLDLSVRKRSLGVQYQYKPECCTKSVQYEPSNMSRSCQANTVKSTSRGCQYESRLVDTGTQSEESAIATKPITKRDKSCEAKETKPSTKSTGCNTVWDVSTATVCVACLNGKKEEGNRKETDEKEELKKKDVRGRDESLSVSKIPRLQLTPVLRRQETYSKIPTSPTDQENIGLSGLDLSVKSSPATFCPFNKTEDNYTIPEASKNIQAQNEINKPTLIRSDTYECTSTASGTGFVSISQSKHREKVMPSKEMQGAMKVLNDSLQNHTRLQKNHRAINIIQQEWFKMAGLLTANPLDVEDYLDSFEDTSSLLLDYIVNMTDASGNTAMHYAVSHGNFDVVSILLDSKVCDINKPNKAGYTSVMLVSLADIRSQTHAHVVKRLFQMADVNIRAKQHGQTALMLAVSHGRLDMVKMLLEAGADINIQDDDGSTALMCAAEHGHIEIVKHFLSQPDCDSTITDVDGSTALKIAMEAGHRPIGVLLYAHERSLAMAVGHKHKKKSTSPRPPSSPLSVRQSRSALNDVRSPK